MKKLNGSCLCGKVQIEVPDDFEYMGNCHCSECRKFTGSDYSSVGGLSSEKFRFKAGEDAVSIFFKKVKKRNSLFVESVVQVCFQRN